MQVLVCARLYETQKKVILSLTFGVVLETIQGGGRRNCVELK